MQFNSLFGTFHPNLITILLVSAIPLVLSIGVATDTMRASDLETLLQRAADETVISGTRARSSSDEKIDGLVRTYLSENGALDGLRTISKIEHGDTRDGRLFVRIEGMIDTRFLILVGIPSLQVKAYSEMAGGGN